MYSASHGVSQKEALSVHFSSRKKCKTDGERERDVAGGAERTYERKLGGR